ncbi:ankyrin repeat domain-containing protein 61-like [Cheilinus undulatus]|uniref:ankyrin repeat domain-containing protein 61-like n=1 Tax=Cheilinus undulatus TaxID=241271 RepID=UPI001BD28EBB|nr:ankyrin repeat domain-containing protein 61-like [Cheilinus undulatus]
MDEDFGCLDDVSRQNGSNSLLLMQQGTPGEVFLKGLAVLPLHLAASYRRLKSMERLLSAGADPETRDQLGRTTLHVVIASWPCLGTGLPNPEFKFPTALTSAQKQAEACLRLLCEHSVNINAEVEGGHQTALHLSVRYAALPAVQILSSYGANINAVDSSGMTPLHMAAGMLHKDLIASLIKEGADVNMGVKHSGNTPLHLATVAMAMKTSKTLEEDISCLSELLKQGAEVDSVNKAGFTPLHEVCSMGSKELVDLLLEHGANINKLSKSGENCLFLFLNHRMNVRNQSLLVKLLSLTSPLTVYNHSGLLPFTLTLPCFFKQREQLFKVIQQPRRLHDICKCEIYLKYVQSEREVVRKVLPKKLYDFVFNSWENLYNITFESDAKQDSFTNLFTLTPT